MKIKKELKIGAFLSLISMLISFFAIVYFSESDINFILSFIWGLSMYAVGIYQAIPLEYEEAKKE